VVKNFTRHLGACAVGICKVNPRWIYSKRGEIHFNNWEDWGTDIPDLPKYAVVFAVEMNYEHVMAAPHTPTVAESANRYAEGAYISTVLGQWFKDMGYKGIAQHLRHYDTITTALAVDAGLGEVGRQGYLITPNEGARTRVFAALTDMPLIPDKPISIGVEEYCTFCKKCGATCPSKSIPMGEKTVHNGVEKWKLDELSCYEYWSRVGTDCAICMAVCGFSRPNTPLHKTIKWFIKRKNPIALRLFPHMDDLFYGKNWKPRMVSRWLKYN
jgi:reductive dehalogenase